jgi:hypothetical protein
VSSSALHTVIDRAVSDEAFRKKLFSDPDAALSGFDLTDGEIATLKGLNAADFDGFAGGLGGRSTKGFTPGTG